VEAASRDYQARGYAEAYRAAVPTGGEVVYLDNGTGAATGFLELLPVTPGMDATFTRFWEASRTGTAATLFALSPEDRHKMTPDDPIPEPPPPATG
jgi:hypothetical protein